VKVGDIETRANEALAFLVGSDDTAADLKHAADVAEARYESTVDALFLHMEGAVEVRKASARTAETSQAAKLDYLEAQRKYDAVANKRRSEAMAVEWCRSLYSNYRQGK